MRLINRMVVITLLILVIGCGRVYETASNKDISVKERSIWMDVDYDSRVCDSPDPLPPLPPLEDGVLPAIPPIKE